MVAEGTFSVSDGMKQLKDDVETKIDHRTGAAAGCSPWYMCPTLGEHVPKVRARKVDKAGRWMPVGDAVVVGNAGHPGLCSMPIAIDSVSLPAHAVTSRDGVTYFAVDVTPADGGAMWRVYRRYRHFHELSQLLACRKGSPALSAPFPGKTWLPCFGGALEARRCALEAWLTEFLGVASRSTSAVVSRTHAVGLVAQVRSTGRVGKVVIHDGGDEVLCYKLAFADGLEPAEDWLPRDAVDTTTCLEIATRLFFQKGRCAVPFRFIDQNFLAVPPRGRRAELMVVAVPAPVGTGDLLKVRMPAGPEIVIVVPWRTAPKGPLGLWYDARAGTLAVDARQ